MTGSPPCAGVRPDREAELKTRGWQRRQAYDEPRLTELVEEYRAAGFEVLLEPFDPTGPGNGACGLCFNRPGEAARFKVIYTKPIGLRV